MTRAAVSRIIARCSLLEIALRDYIDYEGQGRHWRDHAIHQARELRREIRQARA